jgi:hypothetical protein
MDTAVTRNSLQLWPLTGGYNVAKLSTIYDLPVYTKHTNSTSTVQAKRCCILCTVGTMN